MEIMLAQADCVWQSKAMKTKEQLPEEVKIAWDNWMKCNLWRSTLSREEAGRLGAAKRKLNGMLRKHALTFDDVGKAMV